MPSRAQNKAIGGITPLGLFIITPGTPQRLTSKLSSSGSVYAFSARQVSFSVDSSVSGNVYINYGNYPGEDTNATALIVPSGTSASLPLHGVLTEGLIDCTSWWLDGSAACKVAVFAADASS